MDTNRIGLDKAKTKELSEHLNILLSSYQMHYQNLRGLHWNIQGENFFELHVKYEELYTRAQVIIVEIAERILTLGATPHHTFSDYTSNSLIKAHQNITDGKEGMTYIADAYQTLLEELRKCLTFSGDIEDEGTNSLMSDLISEHEKEAWMFNSWLKRKI
ncbi:MAG: DNA starvation/stationary phase protection protein [Crocinitomicaceae bacterium]|nr:DNA starvation/stationary phase protection protein [Crocinitomicaceae bacterium]